MSSPMALDTSVHDVCRACTLVSSIPVNLENFSMDASLGKEKREGSMETCGEDEGKDVREEGRKKMKRG